jgi:hypothetical protein
LTTESTKKGKVLENFLSQVVNPRLTERRIDYSVLWRSETEVCLVMRTEHLEALRGNCFPFHDLEDGEEKVLRPGLEVITGKVIKGIRESTVVFTVKSKE